MYDFAAAIIKIDLDQCIIGRFQKANCRDCDVCPLDAIDFSPYPSIDELKCIGCGICYSACRFSAIDSNKDDMYILNETEELEEIKIGCIFSQSDIKVSCISRITDALLLYWIAHKKRITVIKGRCNSCKFKETKKLFFYNLKKAITLADAFDMKADIKVKTIPSKEKFIPTLSVSRRDLFKIRTKSKKITKREIILGQLKGKKPAKELEYPETATISIEDGCILCGICEHICPQEAILIEKDAVGKVFFNPMLCVGCKECIKACLYNAISIKPATTKNLAQRPYIVFEVKQQICPSCGKSFYSTTAGLCPTCKSREQKKKSLLDFIKNI